MLIERMRSLALKVKEGGGRSYKENDLRLEREDSF